jgi:hypothetical protein
MVVYYIQIDKYGRFEVFTAVIMKQAVFWDVAPCRSCVNRRFGGTYRLHLPGRKIRELGTSVRKWLQFLQFYYFWHIIQLSIELMNINVYLIFKVHDIP